jgi:glycolate oxidase FAD binding subunit
MPSREGDLAQAVENVQKLFAPLVGESHVLTEEAAGAACGIDGKSPRCVVLPTSAEEVAAVLRLCTEHKLAVVAMGNGTKPGLGNLPRRYDVALSLKEMTRVWNFEAGDLTIVVEPGMKMGDLQRSIARDNLWLPLDPFGGSKASLGGILATNCAGPLRLFYGTPRDMVLGLKFATSDGKVIKTGGRVVKNVAGYDLGKLLIGSLGTLGVIVEASFKLYPKLVERATFAMPTGTLGIARDLRRQIQDSPLQPLRLVLLDSAAATYVRADSGRAIEAKEPEIWVEVGGSPRVIERCARDLEQLGRAVGSKLDRVADKYAETAWERISDFPAALGATYPGLIILKAGLPRAGGEEFLSRAQQEAESERIRLASFGHTGVGTIYLCLLEHADGRGLPALVGRLRQAAEGLGGALVVERCPYEFKREVDVWGPAGDDFDTMRQVKALWDPKGVMAPGRFVGGL